MALISVLLGMCKHTKASHNRSGITKTSRRNASFASFTAWGSNRAGEQFNYQLEEVLWPCNSQSNGFNKTFCHSGADLCPCVRSYFFSKSLKFPLWLNKKKIFSFCNTYYLTKTLTHKPQHTINDPTSTHFIYYRHPRKHAASVLRLIIKSLV